MGEAKRRGRPLKVRSPLTNDDGEVRELTIDDFKDMRPIQDTDPGMIDAMKVWKEELSMAESSTERAPMRPNMREEDPRAAAEARAAEILQHIGSMDEGTDEFYFDPALIPDGWTYEWKRHTTLGKEDPAYQVSLTRTGWQAVPVSRHPEMMPAGWVGPIIRSGNMLMERPRVITDMVRERDQKQARDQIKIKEAQLTSQPVANMPSGFDATNKGNPLSKIKSSYEPMAIPK